MARSGDRDRRLRFGDRNICASPVGGDDDPHLWLARDDPHPRRWSFNINHCDYKQLNDSIEFLLLRLICIIIMKKMKILEDKIPAVLADIQLFLL